MLTDDSGRRTTPHEGNRRDFLKRVGLGAAAAAAVTQGAGTRRAAAQSSSPYPDWIPPSTKAPKRGGTLTRASAWDPPVLDPRLTNSVGLFQIASPRRQPPRPLPVHRRGGEYRRPHAQGRPRGVLGGQHRPARVDLQAAPGRQVAQRAAAQRPRAGRRGHQVLLRGSTPRKACRRSPSRRSRGWRRPTSTRCASISRRRTRMFPQNLAEAVSVIFSREVLEEDGDLKKRMIGTGPLHR